MPKKTKTAASNDAGQAETGIASDMRIPSTEPEQVSDTEPEQTAEVMPPAVNNGESGNSTDPETQIPTVPEQTAPYKAIVIPGLLVVRRTPDGPVAGTLSRGDTVTVTGRRDGYAQMDNGLFIRESHIRPL